MKQALMVGAVLMVLAGTCSAAEPSERFPHGIRIGSWTTVEGLLLDGQPPTYGLLTEAKTVYAGCDPGDARCRRSFSVECSQGRYRLSFLGPCPTCGAHVAGPVDITVSVDGNWFQFHAIGRSDDDGMVEAPLSTDQVLAISHSVKTIGVGAQGRPYIYVETAESARAIGMLAAFCERDIPKN